MKKKLTNKRLIGYLVDHKHIDLVTVSKTNIICTVGHKFRPDEVKQLLEDTGQPMPRMTSDKESNYIIFPRW
ncbi:hypothetical protein [Mediterranea massiliensis]|jgi:hypothetical protein|uniref:hypothetical protein n=1 Tax=Mediterranea massiliensis TaxID=1841865 RepID=UPI0023F25E98|nr:hypothetical protein [Mediterranea massiliensis]